MCVIVTGSYPPDVCGVGDYTKCILESEYATIHKWSLYYSQNWNLNSLWSKLREIKKLAGMRDIYIEYPTEGYGNSPLPYILAIVFSLFFKNRTIMVFHECNMRTFKSRCAIYLVLLLVNRIIFTNNYHKQIFCNKVRSLTRKCKVVKIFSNIPQVNEIKSIPNRKFDIAIFGHVRESKGINDFIKVIEQLKHKGYTFKPVILGQVPKGHEDYFHYVKHKCEELGIELLVNLSLEEVAKTLNECKLMLYFFKDGLSEKRGSFLASALNGALICSNNGVYTTDKMRQSFFIIDKDSIFDTVVKILTSSDTRLCNYQEKVLKYVENEIPHSWNEVAYEYTKW